MAIDWFENPSPLKKIESLPDAIAVAMKATGARAEFFLGRGKVRVVAPAELPPKPGLSSREGQARLLHDLGSIEMQAMELAARSLFEYPEAPPEFRAELAEIALSEARHLKICLNGLESLGYEWGAWDVHVSLWNAVSSQDSLLDRILIVHRYLEGSGLDAGESLLRRLAGVASKETRNSVKLIVSEEIDHVQFGSRWFLKVCAQERRDPEREFAARIGRIAALSPRREKLARELRLRAGFTEFELGELEKHSPGSKSFAGPEKPPPALG